MKKKAKDELTSEVERLKKELEEAQKPKLEPIKEEVIRNEKPETPEPQTPEPPPPKPPKAEPSMSDIYTLMRGI